MVQDKDLYFGLINSGGENLLTKVSFESFWRQRKRLLNAKTAFSRLTCYLIDEINLCGSELDKIIGSAHVSFDCMISADAFLVRLLCGVGVFEGVTSRGIGCRHILWPALGRDVFVDVGLALLGSGFFEVGWVDDCPLECLIIVDGKELFLSTQSDSSGRVGFLWSNAPSLVEIGQSYFDELWTNAKVY